MPTTNQLIEDLHNKGLAMRRGGAEHMMIHKDTNNETTDRTKQDELNMELEFLQQLPKQTKHRLAKRLKHLERFGALKI
jgi:hypothetical protein